VLTHGKSAGFQGRGIPDPLTPPNEREVVVFDQPETVFDIQMEPTTQLINIQFMYQSAQDSIVSLSVLDKQKNWIPFLLESPLLHKLNWFYITDEPYVIYQRDFHYTSLRSLTEHVPPNKILTDTLLMNASSLDGYDFVVTKRQPQGTFGTWWWFRKNIRLNEAFRESDGTAYMKITTTKPPFRLTRQVITSN
jgi:hypothetical protein